MKAPVKLTFDTLEKTVREETFPSARISRPLRARKRPTFPTSTINKYFNLSQQIDAYDRQISELKKSRDGITDTELLKSINAQINVLQAQRESLYRQYNDLDDDEDDARRIRRKRLITPPSDAECSR